MSLYDFNPFSNSCMVDGTSCKAWVICSLATSMTLSKSAVVALISRQVLLTCLITTANISSRGFSWAKNIGWNCADDDEDAGSCPMLTISQMILTSSMDVRANGKS